MSKVCVKCCYYVIIIIIFELQVSESNYGREHVVPSIVQFGFALLESVAEGNRKELGNFEGTTGVEKLGIQILKTLFEVHDMARDEVSTSRYISQFEVHALIWSP